MKIEFSSLILFIVLCTLAFLTNYTFNLVIAFEIAMIFGSAIVIFSTFLLSRGLVLGVGLVSALTTYFLWGHIFAFPIYFGEAVVCYFFHPKSQNRNFLLYKALMVYWSVVVPVIGTFVYFGFVFENLNQAFAVAIKQSANGFLNIVLSAFLVVVYLGFRNKKGRNENFSFSVGEFFTFLIAVVSAIPLVFFGIQIAITQFESSLEISQRETDLYGSLITNNLEKELSKPYTEFANGHRFEYSSSGVIINSDRRFLQVGTYDQRSKWLHLSDGPFSHDYIMNLKELDNNNIYFFPEVTNYYSFEFVALDDNIATLVYNFDQSLNIYIWEKDYISEFIKSNLSETKYSKDLAFVNYELFVGDSLSISEIQKSEHDHTSSLSIRSSSLDEWLNSHIDTYNQSSTPGLFVLEVKHDIAPYIKDMFAYLSVIMSIFVATGFVFFVIVNGISQFLSSRISLDLRDYIKDSEEVSSRSFFLSNSYMTEFRLIGSWLNEVELKQQLVADDLTQLIDTANAPIFGIDAQGNVNEWNQTAERITGFSRYEVMGKDLVSEFITDDYKSSVKEVLDNALKGNETANYEFPLFTAAGNRVDVLLNSTTRRDASGKIVGVVGVGQDITELNQVRVEQQLVADDLTQLIDTANAPIFGIDAQGNVNEWNQTAERITGFSRYEVMGKDLVSEFITDDYKSSVKEVLDNALKGNETANYEFPLFTAAGNRVDVLLNSTTRRDASGKIVGVVGVGQDITELKVIQSQVIHNSKLATLGEMATGVAHELNQPLNVIRLAASNIQLRMDAGRLETDYLGKKIERIVEQTVRVTAIIDHMRMFGRKPTEKPDIVYVSDIIDSTLDLIYEQLRVNGINVIKIYDKISSAKIECHPILLEQVLINLISNARDAVVEKNPTEQKITLRHSIDENMAVIEVIDNGGGLKGNIENRIFEPFFTTKEIGSGTGLGLSVSYGIIRDLKGSLSYESVSNGSNFKIKIPVTDEII